MMPLCRAGSGSDQERNTSDSPSFLASSPVGAPDGTTGMIQSYAEYLCDGYL